MLNPKQLLFAFTLLTTSVVAIGQSHHILRSDSGYAEINGTKLYWETAGIGEAIVLIHGSFGDRRFWNTQLDKLTKKHKVLRYDLRGYGRSALPDPSAPYSDADDLNALLGFLGIEKAHICGLSLGSIVAIDFALAYPDKCISLIPCGPRVAGDESGEYRTRYNDSISAIIQKTIEILKDKGTKAATDFLWAGDHAMSKGIISAYTRTAMLQMGYEYSWWRYLHSSKRTFAFPAGIKYLNKVSIPTLVVTAQYDFELCKNVAAVIAKGVPRSKLISIKNAGHIMNMDNPREFNKAILKFIRNVRRHEKINM